jgi:hypothetical protein
MVSGRCLVYVLLCIPKLSSIITLSYNPEQSLKLKKYPYINQEANNFQYPDYFRYLESKPEGKRPLGTSRRRWVNNIKTYLREVGWDGRDWIDLAQEPGEGLM